MYGTHPYKNGILGHFFDPHLLWVDFLYPDSCVGSHFRLDVWANKNEILNGILKIDQNLENDLVHGQSLSYARGNDLQVGVRCQKEPAVRKFDIGI
jgi:hypothetical protein